MDKPKYVYVTYIVSTPEQVWNALTDGDITSKYWGRHRNASDWKVGSQWEHQDYDDAGIVDIVGKVLESKPPERLVISWAFPRDRDNEEATSRVTFEIVSVDAAVRLTVTHSDLEPDSDMLKGITNGWPIVLSSLKSFLETGKPLASMAQRHCGSKD